MPYDLRFGNYRVPKMYAQINELRRAITAEGSPRIQAAWDKVKEHIDFAYWQAGQADQVHSPRHTIPCGDPCGSLK